MLRGEIFAVDAVLDRDDAIAALGYNLREKSGFFTRDEQACLRPRSNGLFESEEPPCFAPIDRRNRPGPALRVNVPLGGIHIDEIDQRAYARRIEHVLGHGG